jgi:hypothetical protein
MESPIDVQIANGANDCQMTNVTTMGSGGIFASNLVWVAVGNYSSTNKRAHALLFPAVTMPTGATITAAYLSYKAYNAYSATVQAKIWANDTATPAAPTTGATFWALAQTTASVAWTIGAWSDNTWYNSPDLSAIVQELVGSYDYSAGVAMQFICWDDGSSAGAGKAADSYDGLGSDAPKLHIEYTEASTGFKHCLSLLGVGR